MRQIAKYTGLIGWLALALGAGAFGSRFRPGLWYRTLDKPPFTPPRWVFGPVWTVLYGLMGTAAWLVWRRTGIREGKLPLGLYLLQLGFNAAWSWVFFGLHRVGASTGIIAALWASIVTTAVTFFKRSRLAGALLVPYLAWVSFAGALNYGLWRRNRLTA